VIVKSEGKKSVGRGGRKQEGGNKIDVKGEGCKGVD
jgi:hypothetical protein